MGSEDIEIELIKALGEERIDLLSEIFIDINC